MSRKNNIITTSAIISLILFNVNSIYAESNEAVSNNTNIKEESETNNIDQSNDLLNELTEQLEKTDPNVEEIENETTENSGIEKPDESIEEKDSETIDDSIWADSDGKIKGIIGKLSLVLSEEQIVLLEKTYLKN